LLIKFTKTLFLLLSLIINIQIAKADDNYLQGYLSAILEQQLGWNIDSYHLNVEDSVATIIIKKKNSEKISDAKKAFSTVPGLVDFNFVESADADIEIIPSYIHYPRGDYFIPPIADVKEPQFFLSFVETRGRAEDILIGSVGLGHNFGLYRWPASTSGDGFQLSFFGALFSQFNMDAASDDLLNSDYLVGFPLSFRQGSFSGRVRFFHQSSHLGDELLISGSAPERVNLSVEVIDFLLAYDIGHWTGMIGALKIISHDPSIIKEHGVNAAINYRNPTPILGNSRFLAGISTSWIEDINWKSGTSFKAGLEIGQSYPHRRGVRIMFEAYKGFVPFGQFYTTDLEYYGLGMYFDFN